MLLAMMLQTDMTDQQQQAAAKAFAGLGFGFIAIGLLFGLAVVVFTIFLFWKIFTKAGMAGPLSLLVLIWPIGLLIVLCILAFADWKVVPAPAMYGGPPLPPNYPPQNLPPGGYPPQQNY